MRLGALILGMFFVRQFCAVSELDAFCYGVAVALAFAQDVQSLRGRKP